MPRSALVFLLAMVVAACGGGGVPADPRSEAAIAEHRARGDRALAAMRPDQALIAYLRARELAPTDPELQRAVMRARVELAASDPTTLDKEALADVEYAAQLMADAGDASAAALTALGHIELRRGDLARARGRYEAALRADSGSAVAHTALGLLTLRDRATRASGKGELEAALTARPDWAPALLALARVAIEDGQEARAVELLERRLATQEDAPTRALLGRALFGQKRFESAVASLRAALAIDPSLSDAQSTLGLALLSLDRPAEAVVPLRVAAEANPTVATLVPLGFALAQSGDAANALLVFDKAIQLDPNLPMALAGAARAAETLGRNEAAIPYWRRIVALRTSGAPNAELSTLQTEARTHLEKLTPPTSPLTPPVP